MIIEINKRNFVNKFNFLLTYKCNTYECKRYTNQLGNETSR